MHERKRDEREKLNILQAERSGIVVLEPEKEREIQQGLDARQKQESEIAAKVTVTAKANIWSDAFGVDAFGVDAFGVRP